MEEYLNGLKRCLAEGNELAVPVNKQLISKDSYVSKKQNEDSLTVLTPSFTKNNQTYRDGSDTHQAILSLPEFLTLRQSDIQGSGYGVWCKLEIPEGMLFGPYEGVVCSLKTSQPTSYSWEICFSLSGSHYQFLVESAAEPNMWTGESSKSIFPSSCPCLALLQIPRRIDNGFLVGKKRRMTQFIDAENEFHSNWLRYVNYAHTEEEQNMIAYQYDGQVYYHTNKTIPPETELLVWYGNAYATELGFEWQKIELKKSMNEMSLPKARIFSLIHFCDMCSKEYTTDERVEAHQQFHSISRHFICDRRFLNQQTHTSEEMFHSKKTHQPTYANDKSFSCNTCKKKFNQKCNLKVHQRIHTGEKPFSCNICEKKFIQKGHLSIHQRIHTGEKPFKCNICKMKFLRKGNRDIHYKIHTDEKQFSCTVCEKKFIRNSSLITHQMKHTGEKPFSCSICKNRFTTNSYLKIHQRIHTGEKPFSCKICEKKFTTRSNLNMHQITHTSEKPFSCNICGKKFSKKSYVNFHQKIHTGEKLFSCNICKKKFTRNSCLKLHQRIHTGVKPFSCNICKKEFICKGYLNIHQRIHTDEKPFICNICKKKFISNSSLTIHQRKHTGEKPFSCNICKKKFYSNGDLNVHQRIHRGEKLFSCDNCQKKFSRKGSLNMHLRMNRCNYSLT